MPPKKISSDLGTSHKAVKKPAATAKGYKRAPPIPEGFIVEDSFLKKQWRIGNLLGQGGFADVYTILEASSKASYSNAKTVIKIEPSDNGPLFQEIHFFKAAAKKTMIDNFMKAHGLKSLGVMEYISSGILDMDGKQLRWLIVPRLGRCVQEVLDEQEGKFSRECVIKLALQMIDVLEYIHSHGYAHGDIKAGNMMTGFGKAESNQVYLIDFGLAKRFMHDGKHATYAENPKAAHDGTLELTSPDAHKGAAPSRRGDMWILGFNLIKWLHGSLPWSDVTDAFTVKNHKNGYCSDLTEFFRVAFPDSPSGAPKEIAEYFREIKDLAYDAAPKYDKIRTIFKKAIQDGKFRKSDLFGVAEKPAAAPPAKRARAGSSTEQFASTSTADSVPKRTRAGSELAEKPANGHAKKKGTKESGDAVGSDEEDIRELLAKLPPGKRRLLKAQLEADEDDGAEKVKPAKKPAKGRPKKVSEEPDPNVTDDAPTTSKAAAPKPRAKKAVVKDDDEEDEVELDKLPPGKRFKAKAAKKAAEDEDRNEDAVAATTSRSTRPKRGVATKVSSYAENDAVSPPKKNTRKAKRDSDDSD